MENGMIILKTILMMQIITFPDGMEMIRGGHQIILFA